METLLLFEYNTEYKRKVALCPVVINKHDSETITKAVLFSSTDCSKSEVHVENPNNNRKCSISFIDSREVDFSSFQLLRKSNIFGSLGIIRLGNGILIISLEF